MSEVAHGPSELSGGALITWRCGEPLLNPASSVPQISAASVEWYYLRPNGRGENSGILGGGDCAWFSSPMDQLFPNIQSSTGLLVSRVPVIGQSWETKGLSELRPARNCREEASHCYLDGQLTGRGRVSGTQTHPRVLPRKFQEASNVACQ